MPQVMSDDRLAAALEAGRSGSGVPHVVVDLPSLSLSEPLLSHYADRVFVLEHRYLLEAAMLARQPDAEMVFLCSVAPSDVVLDDCFGDLPASVRADCRRRFHVVAVDDPDPRSLSAKLLDRPDLLERVRRLVGDRPAYVDPYNVTGYEVAVAAALDLPLYGTAPERRRLGFKSEGRRRLRAAGVPVAPGVEDVRTSSDVAAAVRTVAQRAPGCPAVVVKLDDSASGDGNRVIRLDRTGRPVGLDGLPVWYLDALAAGGVVEELVVGEEFASPSAQVDIRPDGTVVVDSTHEQVLGGDDLQVYQGCRFPADPEHAAPVARHAAAVAAELAGHGAVGRLGVDFAAVRAPDGTQRLLALEVNIRKGGTTHPFAALRHLVPGRYEVDPGRWVALDGTERCYVSTDNLVDPRWQGRGIPEVVGAVRDAGLRFDPDRGTGVVLHMLSCLAVDGRLGVVAIGTTREHAAYLFAATSEALHR